MHILQLFCHLLRQVVLGVLGFVEIFHKFLVHSNSVLAPANVLDHSLGFPLIVFLHSCGVVLSRILLHDL